MSMLRQRPSRWLIRTNGVRSEVTTGRRTVSGSPGRGPNRTTCHAFTFTRLRTNSRPPSPILGTALAKLSSATTGNICCSAPRVISNRPLETRNSQTSIATWSAFISSRLPRRLRIRSHRKAMKSAKQRKNAKKKKKLQRKKKRHQRLRNRKRNQRSKSL